MALGVATCRPSRFCADETLSACRFPSVPSQAPCLPLAGESIAHTSAWETSRYLPCTPLSKGMLWSSFEDCPFAEPVSYYGGSVAVRLSTGRRSRVCAYETLSACRSPSVPSQAHCLPLAGESVPPSAITLMYSSVVTSDMLWRMWTSSGGPWIRQSQSNHAHRTCRAARYMPSPALRFRNMLLSFSGFPSK